MDFDFILAIVIIGVCIIGSIAVIIGMVRSAIKPSKGMQKMYDALDEEIEEPEPEVVGAVAISKRMDGYWGGNIKTPQYYQCYFITFLTDDGEQTEYMVGKETFDKIYEGQASTLVTVEGQFFAFDDGEEIEEGGEE